MEKKELARDWHFLRAGEVISRVSMVEDWRVW